MHFTKDERTMEASSTALGLLIQASRPKNGMGIWWIETFIHSLALIRMKVHWGNAFNLPTRANDGELKYYMHMVQQAKTRDTLFKRLKCARQQLYH